MREEELTLCQDWVPKILTNSMESCNYQQMVSVFSKDFRLTQTYEIFSKYFGSFSEILVDYLKIYAKKQVIYHC